MERKKYDRLLSLVTSKEEEKSKQLLSRDTSQGDFRLWGKVAIDEVGAGDWLIGSWSVDGVPSWTPRMHYYRREDRKFYLVRPSIASQTMELIVDQEDAGLDPQRAKFITESIEAWERELQPIAS
jgi:hypothetical protein